MVYYVLGVAVPGVCPVPLGVQVVSEAPAGGVAPGLRNPKETTMSESKPNETSEPKVTPTRLTAADEARMLAEGYIQCVAEDLAKRLGEARSLVLLAMNPDHRQEACAKLQDVCGHVPYTGKVFMVTIESLFAAVEQRQELDVEPDDEYPF